MTLQLALRSTVAVRGSTATLPDHCCFRRMGVEGTELDALGGAAVQTLIELIAGFIVFLTAAALSQFGVDIHAPRPAEREVHRVGDCRSSAAAPLLTAPSTKPRC